MVLLPPPVQGIGQAGGFKMQVEDRSGLATPQQLEAATQTLIAEAGKDPDRAAIDDWILHDLRRTATTGMARLNIPPHVVDKILNHVSGTIRGVAAVYNRHSYIDERRAALETWSRHVESLVRPPAPSNVVELAAAR